MEERGKETAVSEDEETIVKDDEKVDEQSVISNEEQVETDENKLVNELQALTEEKNELNERMLRIHAEFENFKRRTEKERIAERKYKSQDLVNEILPVVDNFDRALQTEVTEENKGFLEGIQMVYNQLEEALKSQGVERVATVNEQFDPNVHHAVMQVEDDEIESNIVVEELQKGYMLKDRVIRPAMVKVNK